MVIKVQRKESDLGYITDIDAYISSRKQADKLAKDHNLVVASMPQLISALTIPEMRADIRPQFADTTSVEYQGQNSKGNRII